MIYDSIYILNITGPSRAIKFSIVCRPPQDVDVLEVIVLGRQGREPSRPAYPRMTNKLKELNKPSMIVAVSKHRQLLNNQLIETSYFSVASIRN